MPSTCASPVYHQETAFYRDDHRRLLNRISEQAAAVIHNSILYEQAKEDSLTDPLTGLPNTRFLFMHLTRELVRAERLNAEVALILMHLDKLRSINDAWGYRADDRALCEVAKLLRAAIRPGDICVRYDRGAWFMLILSGCGADEAERKRLELQEALACVPFEGGPGQPVTLGLSAGAAIFPHDGKTFEALFATASQRLS